MISAVSAYKISHLINYNAEKLFLHSERLSSGRRINRAADDAAGLAISQKLRAQSRGLMMARHNVQDGVSLIQTAEGALSGIQDMLQRMRELSVKSANGTNSADDRAALDNEYQQLMSEIDRVSDTAEFNTLKLLNGSYQSGATPPTGGGSSGGPGIPAGNGIPATQNLTQSPTVNWGANAAFANEVANVIIPNIMNSLADRFNTLLTEFSGSTIQIGLGYTTGAPYTAEVYTGWNWIGSQSNIISLNLGLTLNMTQVANYWRNGSFISDAARSDFEAIMSHEMTHALMAVTATRGMTGYGNDRFPQWFGEGMAQAVSGDTGYISARLSAASTDAQISSYLNNYKLAVSGNQNIYGTGYLAAMYLAWKAGGEGTVTADRLSSGYERILIELANGSSLDSVIKGVLGSSSSGLNYFQNNFHLISDVPGFIHELLAATNGGKGALLTGSLTAMDIAQNTAPATALPLLTVNTHYSRVNNSYPAGYTIMSGGGSYNAGVPAIGAPINTPVTPPTPNPVPIPDPGSGSIFFFQCGAQAAQVIEVFIARMDTQSIGISRTDGTLNRSLNSTAITTSENASNSLNVLDGAFNCVSKQRATLGAAQNRLEHTMKILSIATENMDDANSRIADADMAHEVIETVKATILQDAAVAMLSYAKRQPETVYWLLRGK